MAELDLSKKDLVEGYKRGERALERASKYREQLKEGVRQIAFAGEALITGGGLGFVKGYWGGIKLLGVPLDLVVAAAGHGGALLLDEADAKHAHNVGNSAIAAFGSTFGAGLAVKFKQKKQSGGNASVSGLGTSAPPVAIGAGARVMSEAELAAMASAG